jgi:branched-chain amino acid transport system substrate-binding protein
VSVNRRALLGGLAATFALQAGFSAAKGQSKLIGLSLPLTGNQSEVAIDLQRGYGLALQSTGSDLRLQVLDDAGDVNRTAANVAALVSNSSVIALSGLVGTPHAEKALPIATAGGLPVVGIRSGAKILRLGQGGVYHLRSSYEDELDAVAKFCAGVGIQSVGIVHSDDSFGQGSRKHFVAALKALGIEALPPMPVARDNPNVAAVAATCAAAVSINDRRACVVLLMISRPMSAVAKELREVHKIALPIFAMSFVATRSVSADVIPHLEGLGIVSAFPLPRISNADMSRQFRADCDRFGAIDLVTSPTAFEGYFYGSVIAKTGADSRSQVNQRLLAGLRVYDQSIKFGADMVGYKHLEFVRKSYDGKLKS